VAGKVLEFWNSSEAVVSSAPVVTPPPGSKQPSRWFARPRRRGLVIRASVPPEPDASWPTLAAGPNCRASSFGVGYRRLDRCCDLHPPGAPAA
jgi:hypothetical protein